MFFGLFQHFIKHCFICRTSDFAVSEDAGTSTVTVRRSNPSARSYTVTCCDINFCYPDRLLQTKFVPIAEKFLSTSNPFYSEKKVKFWWVVFRSSARGIMVLTEIANPKHKCSRMPKIAAMMSKRWLFRWKGTPSLRNLITVSNLFDNVL